MSSVPTEISDDIDQVWILLCDNRCKGGIELSKNNKIINAFETFKELSSIIRENLIAEAVRINDIANFMDNQEFEKKIKCLNNSQIAEITRDIWLWHTNKILNTDYEEYEKDKLKLKNNQSIKEFIS